MAKENLDAFKGWIWITNEKLDHKPDGLFPNFKNPYKDLAELVSKSNPLDSQEGGNHYKKYKIQPVEFCHKNNIPWCESNVIKYVCRHRDKNGIEDLKKAMHYLELLIKLDYE